MQPLRDGSDLSRRRLCKPRTIGGGLSGSRGKLINGNQREAELQCGEFLRRSAVQMARKAFPIVVIFLKSTFVHR